MEKLIKERSSGSLIGKGIRDKFKHLSSLTKDDLVGFQENMKAGKHPEVTKFYEDAYKDLKAKGIDLDKKDNYLPQIWENTPEEIAKAFGDKELNARLPSNINPFLRITKKVLRKVLLPSIGQLN